MCSVEMRWSGRGLLRALDLGAYWIRRTSFRITEREMHCNLQTCRPCLLLIRSTVLSKSLILDPSASVSDIYHTTSESLDDVNALTVFPRVDKSCGRMNDMKQALYTGSLNISYDFCKYFAPKDGRQD